MIYDCFPFFNEFDILDARLHILNSVVDKFVLVEANRTFSGKEKEFYFENNKDQFKDFLDKIIHIKVEDMPVSDNYWIPENFQRNQITRGLIGLHDDDVVIISDCDEIPDPKFITSDIDDNVIYGFNQKMFYYYFNLQQLPTEWYGSAFLKYSYLKTITPQYVRNKMVSRCNDCVIYHSGWHFSYINTIDNIKYKIESFAHKEFITPDILNNVDTKVKERKDIFNRNYQYKIVPKVLLPEYIITNEKFSRFILPEVT